MKSSASGPLVSIVANPVPSLFLRLSAFVVWPSSYDAEAYGPRSRFVPLRLARRNAHFASLNAPGCFRQLQQNPPLHSISPVNLDQNSIAPPSLRRSHPRKSNSPSGTMQMRVFSSFTVGFSLPMISRSRCKASSALPLLHRITRLSA